MSRRGQVSLIERQSARSTLFEAQRFDRVEGCGPVSRVIPKADSDRRTDDQSRDRPAIGKNQVGLEPDREQIATDDAEQNPNDPAHLRNEDGFREELFKNVATLRADRFADADLFGPLRYTHEHDVHDPDAGGNQRDQADNERTDADNAGDRS